MKTTYGCFEKGRGIYEKKKKIVFMNKIETSVPNRNCEFCFTKMEIVLKKVLCTKQALGF